MPFNETFAALFYAHMGALLDELETEFPGLGDRIRARRDARFAGHGDNYKRALRRAADLVDLTGA